MANARRGSFREHIGLASRKMARQKLTDSVEKVGRPFGLYAFGGLARLR
jgi:hypothetical protein